MPPHITAHDEILVKSDFLGELTLFDHVFDFAVNCAKDCLHLINGERMALSRQVIQELEEWKHDKTKDPNGIADAISDYKSCPAVSSVYEAFLVASWYHYDHRYAVNSICARTAAYKAALAWGERTPAKLIPIRSKKLDEYNVVASAYHTEFSVPDDKELKRFLQILSEEGIKNKAEIITLIDRLTESSDVFSVRRLETARLWSGVVVKEQWQFPLLPNVLANEHEDLYEKLFECKQAVNVILRNHFSEAGRGKKV